MTRADNRPTKGPQAPNESAPADATAVHQAREAPLRRRGAKAAGIGCGGPSVRGSCGVLLRDPHCFRRWDVRRLQILRLRHTWVLKAAVRRNRRHVPLLNRISGRLNGSRLDGNSLRVYAPRCATAEGQRRLGRSSFKSRHARRRSCSRSLRDLLRLCRCAPSGRINLDQSTRRISRHLCGRLLDTSRRRLETTGWHDVRVA